jgi:precorrin-4/cobalt-precorrin-4 C11-methyltransferase
LTVYFVGAGPGDPELLTVKAARLLAEAGFILYAGSLVNPEILTVANPAARVADSAGLDLDQQVALMAAAVKEGLTVVRLHTGDPSLYGAIQEQREALLACGVESTVVPGVSSFAAAAAAVGRELTLPGVSQTVIVTRLAGRTPVPEKENLRDLAVHQASMCIFLSSGMLARVAEELLQAYPAETPVAIVEKASWPEERVVRGSLAELAALGKSFNITRQAVILVGEFLAGREFGRSCLYAADFSHGFREGKGGR